MNKFVCLLSLFVSLLFLNFTNGAILNVNKRSTAEESTLDVSDGSLAGRNAGGHLAEDPHKGAASLRHILPIWWHYFRPMVQVTLQEDHLRRELQEQYEHEYDMIEASNDDTVSETKESGTVMNASPSDFGDRTSMENIIDLPNNSEVDDPNERQEGNIIQETLEIDRHTELFPESTKAAFEPTGNEEVLNEARNIDISANFGFESSERTVETLYDDVKVEQEFENSRTVENAENTLAEMSNAEQSVDNMFPEFETQMTTASMLEQHSLDEVDAAPTQGNLVNADERNAIWNNNVFGREFGSTHSEHIFDDRSMQFGNNNNGIFLINDDATTVGDVSEQPLNTDDGRFRTSAWMFLRAGESNADSDFVQSFTSPTSVFTQTSLHSEPDSSS